MMDDLFPKIAESRKREKGTFRLARRNVGSRTLAVSSSYDEASNGNHSSIHWDMVLRQTPEAGGGEIWFDDKLMRKDGLFVVKELKGLNPKALC
jgi:hypothetical protein